MKCERPAVTTARTKDPFCKLVTPSLYYCDYLHLIVYSENVSIHILFIVFVQPLAKSDSLPRARGYARL